MLQKWILRSHKTLPITEKFNVTKRFDEYDLSRV